MHIVSWLVICGSGPWLFEGIYPSAITQRRRPIGSIHLPLFDGQLHHFSYFDLHQRFQNIPTVILPLR